MRGPIRLENDANCFALSEAVDGAAIGAHVVFCGERTALTVNHYPHWRQPGAMAKDLPNGRGRDDLRRLLRHAI